MSDEDYTNIDFCRMQMNRFKKGYNFSGKLFIISNIFAELLDLVLIILHPEPLWYFIDFLVRAIGIGAGFLSFSRHNSKYCCISIFCYLVAMGITNSQQEYFSEMFSIFFGFGFYIIFSLVSVVSMIFAVFLNQKYHKLEQAEGFPYFNERLEKQKDDMQKFIANDYQAYSVEDFREKCSNNSKMDEL